ncbi:WD40 domain-containing protein [Microcoleus sp. Pol12A5]|uniref:WD40 domain-containing protein n=1 Tax=Microcoleus sp. Pol12A5 TaxID=3055392 RepID=UPI002FD0560C
MHGASVGGSIGGVANRTKNAVRVMCSRVMTSTAIAGLTFSPDGKTIASASYDGTFKLWNSADGTLINAISDHSAGAGDVKFSPDGQMVASSGVHSKVKIWKLDGTKHENIHRTSGSCN